MAGQQIAPILSEPMKNRVCELLGQFEDPADIVQTIWKEYGVRITTAALQNYIKAKKWQPLINRFRAHWVAGVMDMPLAHKRGRMRELEYLYHRALACADAPESMRIKQALSVLVAMREEMAESKTGMTNVFLTNITNYSDDELLRRRDEVLAKMKTLKMPTVARSEVVDAITQEDVDAGQESRLEGHDVPLPPREQPEGAAQGDAEASGAQTKTVTPDAS